MMESLGVDCARRRRIAVRSCCLFWSLSLQCRYYVRNQDNETRVDLDFAEELDEVRTVIGDKREFAFDDSFC